MGAEAWLTITLAVVNGIGIPILIFVLNRQDSDRRSKFGEIHERLSHLDDCIDTTQKLVIGKSVTREDIAAMKLEVTDTINRMRAAISAEHTALNGRVSRLEDPYFNRGRHE